MSGNYRKAYDRAAIIVVGLSEVMETSKLEKKEEVIDYYIKKYSRRSAFKAEIKSLL